VCAGSVQQRVKAGRCGVCGMWWEGVWCVAAAWGVGRCVAECHTKMHTMGRTTQNVKHTNVSVIQIYWFYIVITGCHIHVTA